MGLVTAEALILDVFDLHDQDRIVTLLTREQGKKRGVARGARRKYSRFAGQLQPLAKARVTWFEKPGRDLVRVSSVELIRAADRLQQDLEGILLGGFLAEHLVEFAQENEESELFFRLLDSTLEALAAGVDRDLAARFFEAWVLRLAGIFPAPGECPQCGRPLKEAVLPAAGEALLCARCGGSGGLAVAGEVLEFLRRIGGERLGALAADPPSREALAGAEEVAARVRRSFLQRELKSYRVMRETLAGL